MGYDAYRNSLSPFAPVAAGSVVVYLDEDDSIGISVTFHCQ